MAKTDKSVSLAGGGVLWRRDGDALVVAVVHRPRYDDWSLPKGKLHNGEQTLLGAVREVGEETGAEVEVGRRLNSVTYVMSDGTPKHVSYWAMRYLSGEHEPGDEVDRLQWLTIAEATQLVSYPMDRGVLADFARLPTPTATLLLVRHAKAGKRSDFSGDDRLRPLDKIGRRHSREMAAVLAAFRPARLLAVDKTRCEQTVQPLAKLTGLEIQPAREFSDEACEHDPAQSGALLLQLTADPGTTVVCSQGSAIPMLLHELMVPGKPYSTRKGSAWVLTFSLFGLISADYYPHPNS